VKTILINTRSWHYLLARYIANFSDEDEQDICTYTRHVIGALALLALLLAIGVFFAWIFGDFFGWIVAMIVQWALIDPGIAIVALLIIAVAACCGLGGLIMYWQSYLAETPPGFVREAYHAAKYRLCFRIRTTDS